MKIILHSVPAHSTRIEESGNVEAEYGHFNFKLSDISSADTSTGHNRPYTVVDPLPDLTPPEQNWTVTFDITHMEDDRHSEIAECGKMY